MRPRTRSVAIVKLEARPHPRNPEYVFEIFINDGYVGLVQKTNSPARWMATHGQTQAEVVRASRTMEKARDALYLWDKLWREGGQGQVWKYECPRCGGHKKRRPMFVRLWREDGGDVLGCDLCQPKKST